MAATPKFDPADATRLFATGKTVLEVAHELRVSPQAIYWAIKAGRVSRPEQAEAVA